MSCCCRSPWFPKEGPAVPLPVHVLASFLHQTAGVLQGVRPSPPAFYTPSNVLNACLFLSGPLRLVLAAAAAAAAAASSAAPGESKSRSFAGWFTAECGGCTIYHELCWGSFSRVPRPLASHAAARQWAIRVRGRRQAAVSLGCGQADSHASYGP